MRTFTPNTPNVSMEKLTTERQRRLPTKAIALTTAALAIVGCGLVSKKPGTAPTPSPTIVAECDGSNDTWWSLNYFEELRHTKLDVPKTAYHLAVTKEQVTRGMVGVVFCPKGVPGYGVTSTSVVSVKDINEFYADDLTNPCLVIGDYKNRPEDFGVFCPGAPASKSPTPDSSPTEDPWDQPTPYDYPTDEPYSGFPTDDVYGV